MPTIDRDGVSIYYEDHGAGLPVLLTLGYSTTTHVWRPQIAALSGDYRLSPWDLRCRDQSDSPEDESRYSREHTIEDMLAICSVRTAATSPSVTSCSCIERWPVKEATTVRTRPARTRSAMVTRPSTSRSGRYTVVEIAVRSFAPWS